MKMLLALTAACLLMAAAPAIAIRRPSLKTTLLALGIGCFGVMALTHVFEQASVLPALGWGQPRSVGHFIDLAAALLGLVFSAAGLLARGRVSAV